MTTKRNQLMRSEGLGVYLFTSNLKLILEVGEQVGYFH